MSALTLAWAGFKLRASNSCYPSQPYFTVPALLTAEHFDIFKNIGAALNFILTYVRSVERIERSKL